MDDRSITKEREDSAFVVLLTETHTHTKTKHFNVHVNSQKYLMETHIERYVAPIGEIPVA